MVLAEGQHRPVVRFKIFKKIPGVPENQTPEEGEIDNEVKFEQYFDEQVYSMDPQSIELVRSGSSTESKSKHPDRKFIFEILSRLISELDFTS